MSTDDSNQNLRTFISYARADTEAANRLYNDLKLSGLDPWLDTESLLAGENWRIAIKDAVRNSRYFIPILSSNSIEKIGYVQRELKEALEVLLEFPPSKRFIIPVRLDNIEVNDEKLKEFHIVDLFPGWEQGIQKILKSMGIEGGKLAKTNEEASIYQYDEWNELLLDISEKNCIPYIGPEANIRWIPTNRKIAIKWAEEHEYPFQDGYELPQVAQFMAIKKSEPLYPKKYLSRILRSIHSPNFSAPEYENTIYTVLADLHLPIYVTTNYDHLMELVLIAKGKEPTSDFCRWNDELSRFPKPPYEPPSPAKPLVFHLLGDMDYPKSLVLTEQDYLEFVSNISNSDTNPTLLPSIVSSSIAKSSQLFIGFTLNDMNSRILFKCVAGFSSAVQPPYSVLIMPRPSPNCSEKNIAEATLFLKSYARSRFDSDIRWSDPFMFSIELRNSFNRLKQRSLK